MNSEKLHYTKNSKITSNTSYSMVIAIIWNISEKKCNPTPKCHKIIMLRNKFNQIDKNICNESY